VEGVFSPLVRGFGRFPEVDFTTEGIELNQG
jgi:hypothetical protein